VLVLVLVYIENSRARFCIVLVLVVLWQLFTLLWHLDTHTHDRVTHVYCIHTRTHGDTHSARDY